MSEALTLQSLTKQWAIGLTGGIATGKSTIARLLRTRGQVVIDADQLAREVVQTGTEGLAAIVAHFGPDILQTDGQLDRAKMRQIIFNDARQRSILEGITHPLIQAASLSTLKTMGLLDTPRIWFYEASLLYERGRAADFRSIWVAYCSEPVQIARLMQRDRCSEEQARQILAAQASAAWKAAQADLVIDTDCSEEILSQRVADALAEGSA